MSNKDNRFTRHFDTLIALITHLSSTDHKSRTAQNIADALGLEETEVKEVLTLFPGFFRRSKRQSSQGEYFYTVHLRYARRALDGVASKTLTPDELSSLLNLVSHMTAQEHETSLLYIEMREEQKTLKQTNRITLIVAIVSAVAAISAAIIGAIAAIKAH